MKKVLLFAVAILSTSTVSLSAGGKKDTAVREVTVFAAASMTEALTEIAGLYAAVTPGVNVVFNFDSSGTLRTQIDQGAAADVFISAAARQMDQLEAAGRVAVDTRFTLVENAVVLVVPAGSAKRIRSFADVPVGQYSAEVYTSLGTWDALKASGKVTWGSNVKEVLAHVASGAVDCGIVYLTDAASASGVTVVASAPAGSHGPIVYPAAVLSAAPNAAGGAAFLDFLRGDEAAAVFTRVGFVVP